MRRRLSLTFLALTVSCSHRPPADFAPDPGLVERIREIRIYPAARRACPGEVIPTSYEAVLDDGSRLRFETEYDEDRPPRLHVVFLESWSAEAEAQRDGDWRTSRDPLASAVTGFRLAATLKVRPRLTTSTVVEPDYRCLPHVFGFEGAPGDRGEAGGDGPDVTVRLALLRSPFYERLIVAEVEVGAAPPFYVLADAELIPPREWLVMESRGGRGGRGLDGVRGRAGSPGAAGCPGQPGSPGGPGGNGGTGGPGGRGGRITIVAPSEEPFLSGLVDARSVGGAGGKSGRGGDGGPGGKGGAADTRGENRTCAPGPDGQAGPKGSAGSDGPEGPSGLRAQVITVPTADVFGTRVPPELGDLIRYNEERRE